MREPIHKFWEFLSRPIQMRARAVLAVLDPAARLELRLPALEHLDEGAAIPKGPHPRHLSLQSRRGKRGSAHPRRSTRSTTISA